MASSVSLRDECGRIHRRSHDMIAESLDDTGTFRTGAALRPSRRRTIAFAALTVLASLSGCRDAASDGISGSAGALRGVLGTSASDAGFDKADRVVAFRFPEDHGPHQSFRSEWWYLTAVLTSEDGDIFGTQFTLFRQALAPQSALAQTSGGRTDTVSSPSSAWRSGQIYMAHLAVSDVERRQHVHAERVVRGHPALAGVTAAPFAAHLENWRLASITRDFWPLRLKASTDDFGVELTLRGSKPVVLNGDRGLSHKGPENASYYYSIPRIEVEGTVRVGEDTHAVSGTAWLDREWSTSVLAADYVGWDWFALQLDDGRDLMLFQLRPAAGVPTAATGAGTLIAVDGSSKRLSRQDFSLVERRRWQGWPVLWDLELLGDRPERFTIEAAFADQVMDTSVRYWEGVVEVGSSAGERLGTGYMELTGYSHH